MAIITGDDLKNYMRNETVAVDDAPYSLAAAGAEESVNGYCQRQFVVAGGAATARLFMAPRSPSEVLRIHDCTTITAVSDNGTALAGTDWRAEPLNGLGWDGLAVPFEQLRRVSGYWFLPVGTATVSVTATWGWATIPSKVKMAALIIGKDIVKQRDINSGVAGFGEFGAVRVRQNAIAMGMLDGFRRIETMGIA